MRSHYGLSGLAVSMLLAACASESPTGVSTRITNESAVPVFVIGDGEAHGVGAEVTFWGAQWWKANVLSNGASQGVASFKGYADASSGGCGGTWTSWPGNSSNPPAVLPDEVLVIVTSRVIKAGAAISGDIKEIVRVRHDSYGPAPGHEGKGTVVGSDCGGNQDVVIF
jgi:hypothetical protein